MESKRYLRLMVLQAARAQTSSHEPPRRRAFVRASESIRNGTARNDGPRGHCRRLVYYPKTHMDLLTWIIVGLIAGLIASSVVGGIGMGLLGDIVVGMVG